VTGSVKAIVLDFDGLIADTEVLWLAVLTELYRRRGREFPRQRHIETIGGTLDDFDPFAELASHRGSMGRAELEAEGEELFRRWMEHEAPLPGVRRLIGEARRLGLPLAVASSSRSDSVNPHLRRFGLRAAFDVVLTAEDVERVKPAPDLYLLAAERLGADPAAVLAFEDSGRGVRAAKSAGARCVAVPHVLSRSHDFTAADVRFDSMALCDLDALLSSLP